MKIRNRDWRAICKKKTNNKTSTKAATTNEWKKQKNWILIEFRHIPIINYSNTLCLFTSFIMLWSYEINVTLLCVFFSDLFCWGSALLHFSFWAYKNICCKLFAAKFVLFAKLRAYTSAVVNKGMASKLWCAAYRNESGQVDGFLFCYFNWRIILQLYNGKSFVFYFAMHSFSWWMLVMFGIGLRLSRLNFQYIHIVYLSLLMSSSSSSSSHEFTTWP